MPTQMSAGYELSPQQRQLFAQNREHTVSGVAILLQGKVDPAKARAACRALIERHEILRTSFQRRTGMKFPFQVVGNHGELTWGEVDLSGVNEAEQRLRIEHLLNDSSKIHVEKGVVFHATLTRLGAERNVLALTLSCLFADDASLNAMASEWSAIYSGQPLSEEVLQYADYSEWHNEWLRKEDAETKAAVQVWKQTVAASLPSLALPFERKRLTGPHSWDKLSVPVPQGALSKIPAGQVEDFLL